MAINIAVLAKQIPDPANVGELNSDYTLKREGKIVLDEADLYGVEMALVLREAAGGGKVTIISMAPNSETTGVRTALAMGADDAIVISDDALKNAHSLATAKVLSAAIDKASDIDLIIGAVESSDGYSGTVPAQIAALRNISSLTFASKVQIDGDTVKISRQSNDSIDEVQAQLPALVSVTAGVVEPRYPNFKGIMEAKNKPVDILSLSDLGLDAEALQIDNQKVVDLQDAPNRESGVKIEDVDQAVEKIAEYLKNAGAL